MRMHATSKGEVPFTDDEEIEFEADIAANSKSARPALNSVLLASILIEKGYITESDLKQEK